MSVVGTFESPRKNLARSLAKHAREEAMNRKRKAPESGLLMRFIGIRLSDLHFFERQRLSSNTICCGKVLHLTRLVDAEQTEGLLVFSSFGIGIPGALPSAAPASLDPFPMIWRFNKNGKECLSASCRRALHHEALQREDDPARAVCDPLRNPSHRAHVGECSGLAFLYGPYG